MRKNKKLTNFRKYMVEKFYSLSKEITVEEFCNNHSVKKLHLEDFIEWIELYENETGKITLKKSHHNQQSKKKNQRNEYKKQYQDRKIRYYKEMVKNGEFKFSNDEKINSTMCDMFICDEAPSKIYKLALLLAEPIFDHNFRIKDLNENVNFQLKTNNKEDLNKAIINITSKLETIAFEIDPSNMEIEKVGIHE